MSLIEVGTAAAPSVTPALSGSGKKVPSILIANVGGGRVVFPVLDEDERAIEKIVAPTGYANVGVSFNSDIKANFSGTGANQTTSPIYRTIAAKTVIDRFSFLK